MVLRPCGKGQKCFGLGHMKRGCEGNWVHSAAFFLGEKEHTLLRRGGEREVPHWVRRDEGAHKLDANACLPW